MKLTQLKRPTALLATTLALGALPLSPAFAQGATAVNTNLTEKALFEQIFTLDVFDFSKLHMYGSFP